MCISPHKELSDCFQQAAAPLTFLPARDECFRCSAPSQALHFLSCSNIGYLNHCWGQGSSPHLHINLSPLYHSGKLQNLLVLNCISFLNIRWLFHGLLLWNVFSNLCPFLIFAFILFWRLFFITLFVFFVCFYFCQCPRHVGVPRPGVELMPQQQLHQMLNY